MPIYVAIDLGATSGRVVNVQLDANGIELDLVMRFANEPVRGADGSLVWDFETLLSSVRAGLVQAGQRAAPRSVAIDSWGVDYGLLDHSGHRVGPVHPYRSPRVNGVMEAVCGRVGR